MIGPFDGLLHFMVFYLQYIMLLKSARATDVASKITSFSAHRQLCGRRLRSVVSLLRVRIAAHRYETGEAAVSEPVSKNSSLTRNHIP